MGILTDEDRISRRAWLAWVGAASTSLAGCSLLVGDRSDHPPEYARWDGPSVPERAGKFYYVDLSSIRESEHLPDAIAGTFRSQATRIGVGGGDSVSTLSPANVEYATGGGGSMVVVGEFDARAVVDSLTREGWSTRGGTGNPTLIRSGENRDYALVIDDGVVVRWNAPSTDAAVEAAWSTLAVGNGEARRYVETNEAAGTLVEKLGPGALAGGVRLHTTEPMGSRLAFEAEDVQWRQVAVAPDEATADPEPWREMIENRSEQATGEGRPRTRRERFAVYSGVTVQREGRAVVLEGTLPVAELQTTDVYPAPLDLG